MEFIKLLKKLTNIHDRYMDAFFVKEELASLIAEIKLEAESQTLPKASVNIAKAAKKFSECCFNEYHDKRDGIAGANLYHDNRDIDSETKRQYICDGCVGVSYSKPFDGVVKAAGAPIDANHILRHSCKDELTEFPLPSLAKMKQAVKIEKAAKGQKLSRSILRLPSGKAVNINYMIRLMELCGLTGGETAFDSPSIVRPLYMANTTKDGNEIDGVLLPIHPVGFKEEDVLVEWRG